MAQPRILAAESSVVRFSRFPREKKIESTGSTQTLLFEFVWILFSSVVCQRKREFSTVPASRSVITCQAISEFCCRQSQLSSCSCFYYSLGLIHFFVIVKTLQQTKLKAKFAIGTKQNIPTKDNTAYLSPFQKNCYIKNDITLPDDPPLERKAL